MSSDVHTPKAARQYTGEFAQTSMLPIQVTASTGDRFAASVHVSINVQTDPELLDALEAGSLHHVPCSFTDEVYTLAFPVCVHDPARALFVLVLPSSLRHEEFTRRARLMEELEAQKEVVPSYVRNFHVVFHVREIATLDPSAASVVEEERSEASEALDAQAKELEVRAQQLEDVSARIDRERLRMEEVELKIVQEREGMAIERVSLEKLRQELEHTRMSVESKRLNLEQAQIHQDNLYPEHTQIVTDDQFIEIVSEDAAEPLIDASEILGGMLPHSFPMNSSLMEESMLHDDGDLLELPQDSGTFITSIPSMDDAQVPVNFDATRASGRGRYVQKISGRVVAAIQAEREYVDALVDADPALFIQYQELEHFPLMSILLASLDDTHQQDRAMVWPLDISNSSHVSILDILEGRCEIRFAFYSPQGSLLRTFDARARLEPNIKWMREQALHLWTSPNRKPTRFTHSASALIKMDSPYLGAMRPTFTQQSFTDLTQTSEAKIAAGIVGYWSQPEVVEHLIANRGFPLNDFEGIQQRVVDAALEHGVFLKDALRQRAMVSGKCSDERELAERLMANFAERTTGLKHCDLGVEDMWENWDALMGMAESLNIEPDESILKLAQASMERAQAASEESLASASPSDHTVVTVPKGSNDASSEHSEELVVAQHSDATGITYFLPDGAVLGTFDNLSSMSRQDLIGLLEDPHGRLEAAQLIIEQYGASDVEMVLEQAEQMQASEIASLAAFVETKAPDIEAQLVLCVERGGPSAQYIAARGLVSMRSTSAIPSLLDTLNVTPKGPSHELILDILPLYGERIEPFISRAIKGKGHDKTMVSLLVKLGRADSGLLDRLGKDRNKRVREAVKAARAAL